MSTRDSRGDRTEDRDRRDLLIFLLILFLGFICLLITAQMAVRPERIWQVSAGMLSELRPDDILATPVAYVVPLSEKALTPWDVDSMLTPRGTAVVVPVASLPPIATATPTSEAVAGVPTPVPTPTLPSPTPGEPSATPTPTPTSTSAPSPTPTASPTSMASPTPLGSPTPTPSPTSTPTPTPTPIPPTHTSVPSVVTPVTLTPTPITPTPVPPPSVFSITPNQAYNTNPVQVVIQGANFFGTPTARLGSDVFITIINATADTLTGIVPAGIAPGVYDLTVTNPDGQSATLPAAYRVLHLPPSVFSITPNQGYNTNPVPVVIQGANFFGTPTARLGSDVFIAITAATADTLNGTVPAGIAPGVYDLTVTNPDGQSATLPAAYRVLYLPPSVFSITPNQGYNTNPVPVVIQGANFFGTPTARLGSDVFIAITAATADTLNGTVPAGIAPGVYDLTVINPDGQSATLPAAYTVLRLPPSVFSITPNQGYNTNPVPVVIQGANFFGTPTARLGSDIFIAITAATADTLNGTVPAGITPGVYDLTVTNPDGQSATLPKAYTVLSPPNPDTTLETGYVVTFGPGASGADGDDDYVQVIFFEVPDGTPGDLYVRIFDADTGGGTITETIDLPSGLYNTTVVYTLRGDGGAYTNPNARLSHPGSGGINSGVQLAQAVVGNDPAYHNNWNLSFGPFSAGVGELVGSSRLFKLAVVGNAGDDGNKYNVALSTSPTSNVAPSGSRVFAYSWTFLLTDAERPHLYPYVPQGAAAFEQHNWDMDYTGGTMTLGTPVRGIVVPGSGISGDGVEATSSHAVQAGEDGTTWTVTMEFSFSGSNVGGFWALGDGVDLAIFAQSTLDPPP